MKSLLTLLFCLISIAYVHAQVPVRPPSPEEIEIRIPVQGGDLVGTLAIPRNFNKGVIVLLIGGAGQIDRNGNVSSDRGNYSLQYLSRHLAEAGIASLRYDKRGIAASAPLAKAEEDLRIEDYVVDAAAAIAFLRLDVRFDKVVVAGHGEGALIGMLAAQGKADAYISIAGEALPAGERIKERFKSQAPQARQTLYAKLDSLVAGQTVHVVSSLDALLFRPNAQPYLRSWFRYDPRLEIGKLDIPVLVLQGTCDIEVPTACGQLLQKAQPSATLRLIEGMNHILRTVDGCNEMANMATYSDKDLPITPELVAAVVGFVQGL